MSKIAILTDSSCDIPQELAEKYGIDTMGFHILLDDVDYVERESCTNTEFYDKMRLAKGVPSTAAITPIQFCEKYCQYVDEGYTDVAYPDGAYLVFGREDAGLPEALLAANQDHCIRMPMRDTCRSLNLSNSVAVGVYEVLRQWDFPELLDHGHLRDYEWK